MAFPSGMHYIELNCTFPIWRMILSHFPPSFTIFRTGRGGPFLASCLIFQMFSVLETVLFSLRKQRVHAFGDSVDRLNHQYTVFILLLLALAVCAKQYVGHPIQCWLPNEYRETWEEYIETYCFIESTFFVPLEDRVSEESRLSEDVYKRVSYYQWVPIVLALQAALFYAPHAIWNACSELSGIKLDSIMKAANNCASTSNPSERSARVHTLAAHIDRCLHRKRGATRPKSTAYCSQWIGFRLCSVYLLHKCFYLINAMGQFLTLNSFLNTDYNCWLWGIRLLTDLTSNPPIEWTHSGHFPRLTVCNYPVRRKSETAWESAQCVLMINMINEKIFIFLWFWLAFVCVFTFGNILCTVWRLYRSSSNCRLIRDYLVNTGVDEKHLKRFVIEYLTVDGCLLLYFIQGCADEILNGELTDALFQMFQRADEQGQPCIKKDLSLRLDKHYPHLAASTAYCRRDCEASWTPTAPEVSDEHGEAVKLYCVDEE